MTTANQHDRAQARREYFAQLKKKLGVATVGELAKRLDLSASQIYNLCRVDRHASPEFIERLRKLAPTLEPGILAANEYEGTPPKLPDVISNKQAMTISAFERTEQELNSDARELFSLLGEGDYFVLFTLNEVPVELEPEHRNIAAAMIQALKAGATFIYCVPDADSASVEWMDHFSRRPDSIIQLDDERMGPLGKFKKRLAEQERELEKRLHCVRLKYSPYFVPGLRGCLHDE